jgi:hypothetical protein
MLCQKCGHQKATVHLETPVFRVKIVEHLCALCAGSRNLTISGTSPRGPGIRQIEFTVGVRSDDYLAKLRNAAEILARGRKVKLRFKFRSRETGAQKFGFALLKAAIAELASSGHPDTEPKLLGCNIHVMLSPLSANARS